MNSACFEAIIKKNSSTSILWNYWHINLFEGITVESMNTVFIFAKTTIKIIFKNAEEPTLNPKGKVYCLVLFSGIYFFVLH